MWQVYATYKDFDHCSIKSTVHMQIVDVVVASNLS